MFVLLLRLDAGSTYFAHYGLVARSRLRLQSCEALIHVIRNPDHVLFIALIAEVPATEETPNDRFSLLAVLANDQRAQPNQSCDRIYFKSC